jgi:hypothetical protein
VDGDEEEVVPAAALPELRADDEQAARGDERGQELRSDVDTKVASAVPAID